MLFGFLILGKIRLCSDRIKLLFLNWFLLVNWHASLLVIYFIFYHLLILLIIGKGRRICAFLLARAIVFIFCY